MRLGIIAPINLLKQCCFTTVQYCIPSLIMDNRPYREFYYKRLEMGDTIIMDCRKIGWKREPEDFELVEKAINYIPPSILIAPSYMYDKRRTERPQKEFIDRFHWLADKIYKCIECTSDKEVECTNGEPNVALPAHVYRYIDGIDFGTRTIYIDHHLKLEELDGRDGILVTSLPVRLGLQGRLMSDYRPAPPALTFYEEDNPYSEILDSNIEETLEYYEEEEDEL